MAENSDDPSPQVARSDNGEFNIEVEVVAVLGTATLAIHQILKLGRGAVVELDRGVDEDLDLRVNGTLIARGDVAVIDDNYGVSINNIVRKIK